MRVIELDPAETFYSLRDRILRGGRGRVALVVPRRGAALRGGVDLVLLRRLADRERLEVGLITTDRDMARRARRLGLPAFSSVTLAEHFQPGWWRGKRRAEQVGFRNDERRTTSDELRSQGRWIVAIAALAMVLLALVAVAGAAVFVPRATVRLRPATQPVQIITELSADPALTAPDVARRAVPATEVRLNVPWEANGAGSGAAARQAVRAMALQGLSVAAPDLLAARLDPGRRLVSASVRVEVIEETYATVAGATRSTLQAELTALAVAEADVAALLRDELAAALPAGFALDPATVMVQMGAATGDAATAGAGDRFQATAQATGRGEIDGSALPVRLGGQPLNAATDMLNDLPLAEPPHFDIGPSWWLSLFGRFPLRPDDITVQLTP